MKNLLKALFATAILPIFYGFFWEGADDEISIKSISQAKAWAGQTGKKPMRFFQANIFDRKEETAWCWPEDTGQGFAIGFDKRITINKISLSNGWQKSKQTFAQNRRVVNLSLGSYEDRKNPISFTLTQTEFGIKHYASRRSVSGKKFHISARDSAKFNDGLICITSLGLANDERFYKINQESVKKTIKAARKKNRKYIKKVRKQMEQIEDWFSIGFLSGYC